MGQKGRTMLGVCLSRWVMVYEAGGFSEAEFRKKRLGRESDWGLPFSVDFCFPSETTVCGREMEQQGKGTISAAA